MAKNWSTTVSLNSKSPSIHPSIHQSINWPIRSISLALSLSIYLSISISIYNVRTVDCTSKAHGKPILGSQWSPSKMGISHNKAQEQLKLLEASHQFQHANQRHEAHLRPFPFNTHPGHNPKWFGNFGELRTAHVYHCDFISMSATFRDAFRDCRNESRLSFGTKRTTSETTSQAPRWNVLLDFVPSSALLVRPLRSARAMAERPRCR